jgi:hypothetical protein
VRSWRGVKSRGVRNRVHSREKAKPISKEGERRGSSGSRPFWVSLSRHAFIRGPNFLTLPPSLRSPVRRERCDPGGGSSLEGSGIEFILERKQNPSARTTLRLTTSASRRGSSGSRPFWVSLSRHAFIRGPNFLTGGGSSLEGSGIEFILERKQNPSARKGRPT